MERGHIPTALTPGLGTTLQVSCLEFKAGTLGSIIIFMSSLWHPVIGVQCTTF